MGAGEMYVVTVACNALLLVTQQSLKADIFFRFKDLITRAGIFRLVIISSTAFSLPYNLATPSEPGTEEVLSHQKKIFFSASEAPEDLAFCFTSS